jgi:DNA gyrase/topoisomerase IV subunit B
MGDFGGFTHDNIAVASWTLHRPLNNTDVDFAGGKPLSVVHFSPDAKISTFTDGEHGWTADPDSATGLSARHVIFTVTASSIVWMTDVDKSSFGLDGAAFVASVGISDDVVVETDQAGKMYVSTDFGKSFTYVN